MNEKHSLLNKIKSNYILKDILTLAFKNMKSVLKFIAYNKDLLEKLDINMEEYFDYKIEKTLEKENALFNCFNINDLCFNFIPLMIYDIMFYAIGTFKDKNLKKEYDKKKKNYIDVMNNYILLKYLLLFLIYYIIYIIYFNYDKILIKEKTKLIIFKIVLLSKVMYYIAHIIKFILTEKIVNKSFLWFYHFDIAIICIMSFNLFSNLIFICIICLIKGEVLAMQYYIFSEK